MQINETAGYWSASINPTSITTWYNSLHKKSRHSSLNSCSAFFEDLAKNPDPFPDLSNKEKPANLKDNRHHGKISKIAFKKIRKAIDYTVFLAQPKNLPPTYSGKEFKFRLNFITLTLPAEQMHSDNYLKKNLFQPLLNQFRQKYKVHNYVWRAEKQKNGNLHFHLLTDKFISWSDMRRYWNKYLDKLGYIDKYRENQLAYHHDGFKVRPTRLKTWSYANQYTAYKKGMRENWTDPNSVDVHSLRQIVNVKDYFVKCLAQDTHSPHNEKNPEAMMSELTKDGQTLNTGIEGRLWGCSEDLSHLEGARDDIAGSLEEELQRIKNDKRIKSLYSQYYTFHNITVSRLVELGYKAIPQIFEEYIRKRFPGYRIQSLFS